VLVRGRKYKATLHLLYHSDSQVARVWGGPEGRDEIYETLAWRSYTGFRSLQSAKNVSELLGTYGALATSIGANQGRSGRLLEARSASDGASSNEHEISRELMKVAELLTDLDDDERITFPAGRHAIRHHSAVGWRRSDTRARLGIARHRREPQPLLAAE
jgi:type IV secretory pathway TraG/TraD family ATPase VirD4